jgi:MOSC domain-containing protein YiiM
MKDIAIISVNILNKPELLVSDHQSARSAFRKVPVSAESIKLTMDGFEGDTVAHTKVHGGNDKAICCYNSDHFLYWKKQFGFSLANAAFGENLTLKGTSALESNTYIGDQYGLGKAIVEVSEPRGPCYMIGIRYNFKEFPVYLQQTGFTGYYLRTVKPGTVKITDRLIHLHSHPEKISVSDVNRIRYHDPGNKEWLERLVNLGALTAEWRERFKRMLKNL